VSLFGNRVVVNVISYTLWWAFHPRLTGALRRGERERQRTQGEDDHGSRD